MHPIEWMQTRFDAALSEVPAALRQEVDQRWRAYLENSLQKGVSLHPPSVQTDGSVTVIDSIPRVWSCSEFISLSCGRHPELLKSYLDDAALLRPVSAQDVASAMAPLQQIEEDTTLMHQLRQTRRRLFVRIAWRDLAGWSDLDETVKALSGIADAAVKVALDAAHRRCVARYGEPVGEHSGDPVRLVVLGLGKLGGEELNFSSDIDLILAFSENGHTTGTRALSNHEFFLRVARQLVQLLDETTVDGFVFRTDMRLRPNGDSGPLVLSFDAMEHYYQVHGRDWERYALIKARVIAGDLEAGNRLLSALRPFVYRKYLDFGAFEAIRSMKDLIEREISRKKMNNDLKLGRGGIREIEFIVQSHQLIHGGRAPRLQTQSLRGALDEMATMGLVDPAGRDRLLRRYTFLRMTEHRLQMYRDQQTQALPNNPIDQARLSFAMGFADSADFLNALQEVREDVHQTFVTVFTLTRDEPDASSANGLEDLWSGAMDEASAEGCLVDLGYRDAERAMGLMLGLKHGNTYRTFSRSGRNRLDRLMPVVIKRCAASPDPETSLSRVIAVIEAIGRRSAYLALLFENPLALEQLIKLVSVSSWIGSWIGQNPVILDELLDPIGNYRPMDRSSLTREIGRRLDTCEADDLEAQMDTLREVRHGHLLRIAAADIAELLDTPTVCRGLCTLAESVLQQAFQVSVLSLKNRFKDLGDEAPTAFGIIAYGKLGSYELGYGSDLDIVFVIDDLALKDAGTHGPELDYYFGRLVQRFVHILTTRTRAGQLYEIDMRLRPSGRSGTLVTTLSGFQAYQMEDAWTWEHQAMVRARMVLGDPALVGRFDAIRHETLTAKRDPYALGTEIRAMKTRMLEANCRSNSTAFDLKLDNGGMVDIEFLVQYLVLRHAGDSPELLEYRDNVGLIKALATRGHLDADTGNRLIEIYVQYLATENRLKLGDRPPLIGQEELVPERRFVAELFESTLTREPTGSV